MRMLSRLLMLSLFLILSVSDALAYFPPADSVSIEGRWDVTVTIDGKPSPSWLRVIHSGNHTLVGEWVSL